MLVKSQYINSLIDEFQKVSKLSPMPVAVLKDCFQLFPDGIREVEEERDLVSKYFGGSLGVKIEGVSSSREDLRFYDVLHYNLTDLLLFVTISGKKEFYKNQVDLCKLYSDSELLLKKWLIDNEEAFFDVFLIMVDHYVDTDGFEANPVFVYSSSVLGNFILDMDEFRDLKNFYDAYSYFFYDKGLYPESNRFYGSQ